MQNAECPEAARGGECRRKSNLRNTATEDGNEECRMKFRPLQTAASDEVVKTGFLSARFVL